MFSMLFAETAVLLHGQTIRIVFPVLHGEVVTLFAISTGQCYLYTHLSDFLLSFLFRAFRRRKMATLKRPRQAGHPITITFLPPPVKQRPAFLPVFSGKNQKLYIARIPGSPSFPCPVHRPDGFPSSRQIVYAEKVCISCCIYKIIRLSTYSQVYPQGKALIPCNFLIFPQYISCAFHIREIRFQPISYSENTQGPNPFCSKKPRFSFAFPVHA